MDNRSYEFLGLALNELKARKIDRGKVAEYIRLAIPEIQEWQRLAERRPVSWHSDAVLIVDALAALTGNGGL